MNTLVGITVQGEMNNSKNVLELETFIIDLESLLGLTEYTHTYLPPTTMVNTQATTGPTIHSQCDDPGVTGVVDVMGVVVVDKTHSSQSEVKHTYISTHCMFH